MVASPELCEPVPAAADPGPGHGEGRGPGSASRGAAAQKLFVPAPDGFRRSVLRRRVRLAPGENSLTQGKSTCWARPVGLRG